MRIGSMELNELLRFWDSLGLGDNIDRDKIYSRDLVDLLYKDYYLDYNRYGLINTVLVILDGLGRDMGTSYRFLN